MTGTDIAIVVLSRTTPIPTATPPIISEPPAGASTNNGLSHFSYSGPSVPNEDPPSLNPDLLSPRSWLRLQKHLYMRRIRPNCRASLTLCTIRLSHSQDFSPLSTRQKRSKPCLHHRRPTYQISRRATSSQRSQSTARWSDLAIQDQGHFQ